MSDILATDLIKALYQDAGQEADPERAAQLRRDAEILRDVWERTKYALAPTRDAMTAALGNASLNIADTLSAVAQRTHQMDERVGEIHQHVQDNNTLISTFLESFPTFQNEARAAWEVSAERVGKLEENISLVSDRVDTLEERAEQTEAREQMRDDRIFAVEQRMTATEQRMTDVEAQAAALEREHRQLVTKLRRDAGLLKLINEESGGVE